MTSSVVFSVGEPPKIKHKLEDVVVIAPEKGFLDCELYAGDPPATITWFKDNSQIYESRKYEFSYVDEFAELQVL